MTQLNLAPYSWKDLNEEVLFPIYLTHLTFFPSFNEPFPHLPDTLQYLHLSLHFNQPLEDDLPESITTLIIASKSFNHNINFEWLPNLKRLQIGDKTKLGKFNHNIFENLPDGLTSLKIYSKVFNKKFSKLPSSLLHLSIHSNVFQHPLNDCLPSSLLSLSIGTKYSQHLNSLPSSLTSLEIIGHQYEHSLSTLPTSLKYLSASGVHTTKHDLTNLTSLYSLNLMLTSLSESHALSLPPSLLRLYLHQFNGPLVIPPYLQYLSLDFSCAFLPDILPLSLSTIKLASALTFLFYTELQFPILSFINRVSIVDEWSCKLTRNLNQSAHCLTELTVEVFSVKILLLLLFFILNFY